ncbi:hypothetical protein [Ralstonia pseudosolanacearum]|uniref:DUF2721 domain-containing protein n=1 Tax=Ralstonia pseudosolanacearum TaxID=1310165 RepID=A0A454TLN5_9RALS|nr:hypothetical protein [Ralstonia pseudosolanacearum]RNM03027.1 hypothetical protein EGA29_19845 [Ralstonia pseudosolanacearum]
MKKQLAKFAAIVASQGRYSVLHACVLATVCTVLLMLATASELGPLGPLIVAAAFYLAFAAMSVEVALGLFALTRMAAQRLQRHLD